jgi:hypothetical protein
LDFAAKWGAVRCAAGIIVSVKLTDLEIEAAVDL